MMGEELAQTSTSHPLAGELDVAGVISAVNRVRELKRRIMRKDVHYGVIPGTQKASLLKPGAEVLALSFGLTAKFEAHARHLESGHLDVEVVCTLYTRGGGQMVAQGIGSASSLESKYRYRWDDTGQPVPREYWDSRDPDLLGGPSFSPRKTKDGWRIFQKVEHPDPADYWNTVRKIAKKRSFVDAVITALAAGEEFTQDLEDLPMPPAEEDEEVREPKEPPKPPSAKKTPPRKAEKTNGCTERQMALIAIRLREIAGEDAENQKKVFVDLSGKQSRRQLTREEASKLIDTLNAIKNGEKTLKMDEDGRFEAIESSGAGDEAEGEEEL